MATSEFFDFTAGEANLRLSRGKLTTVLLEYTVEVDGVESPLDTTGWSNPVATWWPDGSETSSSVTATIENGGIFALKFGAAEWTAIGDATDGAYTFDATNAEADVVRVFEGRTRVKDIRR